MSPKAAIDLAKPQPTLIESGLHLALCAGVVGIALLAVKAPQLLPLLPLVIVAGLFAVYTVRSQRLSFLAWFAGFALLLPTSDGIQLRELIYGLFFYSYLGVWYARRWGILKQSIVRGPEDLPFILWLIGGLLIGISTAVLFGANPAQIFADSKALSVVACFFPIKEYCRRNDSGVFHVVCVVAWFGVFITIENLLTTLSVFRSATEVWEIVDIRTAGRELPLTFASILLLSILPTLKSKKVIGLVAFTLVLILGGLLLTKSRTFWVAVVIAFPVLLLLAPKIERRKLLVWSTSGVVCLIGFALLFFGDYFQLIVTGLTTRFESIGTAYSDISLLNRFAETSAVQSEIWKNPILGYGLGTDYSFFHLIFQKSITKAYIHNSLYAVWFKLGLWGVFVISAAWMVAGYKAFKTKNSVHLSSFDRAIARACVACLVCFALPAYTSSVFFEEDKLVSFAIVCALAIGLFQKASDRLTVSNTPVARPANNG